VILQFSISALLYFLAWQLSSFAQAPAAPPSKLCPSRSRHQKPLGLIIRLSNRRSLKYVQAQTYKSGAITERSVPSEVFIADRELDDVYFKIARQ
jgi:hypothetical protein